MISNDSQIDTSLKVIIVSRRTPRRAMVVIVEDRLGEYYCRLPLLNEIEFDNKLIISQQLGDGFIILQTLEEISPWDGFKPFPPQNYVDYGYMELASKKGEMRITEEGAESQLGYWGNLSKQEKIFIEKSIQLLGEN